MDENIKVKVFFAGIIALIFGSLFYAQNKKTSDIVYETDLGEKFIVKHETVDIDTHPMFLTRRFWSGEQARSIANSKKESNKVLTEDIKEDIEYWENIAIERESTYGKKKPILDKYGDYVIVRYEINYKPIFENINGFKTVMKTKTIKCVNPLFAEGDNYIDKQPELDLLDEKVCSKYADFKKDWTRLPVEYKY